jgi:hypothetical protein
MNACSVIQIGATGKDALMLPDQSVQRGDTAEVALKYPLYGYPARNALVKGKSERSAHAKARTGRVLLAV